MQPNKGGAGVTINCAEPPAYLGLLFGSFVHELRCSLDHAVYALTRANERVVGAKAPFVSGSSESFPVCVEEGQWDRDPTCQSGGLDRAGGVPDGALTAIKERQPWHYGEAAQFHPLALLSSLDNRDKHRRLHTTVSSVFLVTERNPDGGGFVTVPVQPTRKEGAALHLPRSRMEVEPRAHLLIALTESGPAPGAIVWTPSLKIPLLKDLAIGPSPLLPEVLLSWVAETVAELEQHYPA